VTIGQATNGLMTIRIIGSLQLTPKILAVQGQRQCCSKCCNGETVQRIVRDKPPATTQLTPDIPTQRQHETIVEEPEEEEEHEHKVEAKNPVLLKNDEFILVDLYEIQKDDSTDMSARPVSRLGPVLTRETNTPKLKSMIVVPTELVMTGAPITAAHRLQNRRVANQHHASSRHYDDERHSEMNSSRFGESMRQNGSRRMTSHYNDVRKYNVTSQLSSMASQSAHVNESFVRSSDDDDDVTDNNDSNSVTSDDSDLARSPAADIIRATYTSPIFDVSNHTLSTNIESADNSVEPCPVDGCPLNPKTRVSLSTFLGLSLSATGKLVFSELLAQSAQ